MLLFSRECQYSHRHHETSSKMLMKRYDPYCRRLTSSAEILTSSPTWQFSPLSSDHTVVRCFSDGTYGIRMPLKTTLALVAKLYDERHYFSFSLRRSTNATNR